jgi:hypothetical protein
MLASYNNAVRKRHIWRHKCATLCSLAELIKVKGKILMGIVQTKSRAHSHEFIIHYFKFLNFISSWTPNR